MIYYLDFNNGAGSDAAQINATVAQLQLVNPGINFNVNLSATFNRGVSGQYNYSVSYNQTIQGQVQTTTTTATDSTTGQTIPTGH